MPAPKIIECPRDALQGLKVFVPTDKKIEWINTLLKVGFDTLDFGAFVSPKAVPQMSDTEAVLEGMDLSVSRTKLLAIVANIKGAIRAGIYSQIRYLGFPLSLSETFQLRNTNKTIAQAKTEMYGIQDLCLKNDQELVVYLSMGFGNPYGDPFHPEMVYALVEELSGKGIRTLSFADTVGIAQKNDIMELVANSAPHFPEVEFGVHLHSRTEHSREKIQAAYDAGCRRFDGVINGKGGCPMAKDELMGNIPTETIITVLEDKGHVLNFNAEALEQGKKIAGEIFR